jgi:hypothetical protein
MFDGLSWPSWRAHGRAGLEPGVTGCRCARPRPGEPGRNLAKAVVVVPEEQVPALGHGGRAKKSPPEPRCPASCWVGSLFGRCTWSSCGPGRVKDIRAA